MKNITYFYLFILLVLPLYSIALDQNSNEIFTIESSKQSLKFSYDDDELRATYTSEEIVKCNIKTGEIFKKFIFFDESSKIEDIRINGSYTKPIITNDFPSDGIFHSDSKLAYVDYRFNSKTAKITVESEKVFNDYKLIDLLKFQLYDYAVEYSEIKIEIPKWLICDIEQFNFKEKNIQISKQVEKNYTIYTFVMTNIAKQESFSSKPDYRSYDPHLMLLPKNMVRDDKNIELLPNLSKLYEWYNSMVKEIGNDNAMITAKVKELILGLSTDEDKIKAIYYYVQDNIKYIAFENGIMGFKPESCQNVYKNRFGDCKGMANLAAEMFKIAGFDARLVWLGTSSVPYSYEYPSVYVDNHMICAVKLNGNFIFIDPTEKNADLHHYADRIQGREVLIQDGDAFIKTTIPRQDATIHETKHSLSLMLDGQLMKGTGNFIYKGNGKTAFSSFVTSTSEKNRKEAASYYIAKNDKNLLVEFNQQNLMPQRDEVFNLTYDIKAGNQVMNVGKENYINLEFDRPYSNVVIEENRNCAYSFSQRKYEDHLIEFTIPKDQKVTYVPKEINVVNEIGRFVLNYTIHGDKIIYRKQIQVDKLEIPTHQFGLWKETRSILNEFYDDRIILEPK